MTKDDREKALKKLEESRLNLADEANLLWDEYKYRHDLIWRHLVRSTLALIALVTVRYAPAFKDSSLLVGFAFFAALLYWIITFAATDRELCLYLPVKAWHRYRQNYYLGIHDRDQSAGSEPDPCQLNQVWGRVYFKKGFPRRVGLYLFLLLVGIIAMTPVTELKYLFSQ